MSVETKSAVQTGYLEGPLPKNPASEIIDQFKDAIGLGLIDTIGFSITTKAGTVSYGETPAREKAGARKSLHVTIGNEDVSANVDSDGSERIGWARRDGLDKKARQLMLLTHLKHKRE